MHSEIGDAPAWRVTESQRPPAKLSAKVVIADGSKGASPARFVKVALIKKYDFEGIHAYGVPASNG